MLTIREIRTQFGAGRSSKAQHSRAMKAQLVQIPASQSVCRRGPCVGLLRAAAEGDDVDVIDARTVALLDLRLISWSVARG